MIAKRSRRHRRGNWWLKQLRVGWVGHSVQRCVTFDLDRAVPQIVLIAERGKPLDIAKSYVANMTLLVEGQLLPGLLNTR